MTAQITINRYRELQPDMPDFIADILFEVETRIGFEGISGPLQAWSLTSCIEDALSLALNLGIEVSVKTIENAVEVARREGSPSWQIEAIKALKTPITVAA